MNTKKIRTATEIKKHITNLEAIFPDADRNGRRLYNFMRRLEAKMHRLATCYCNGYTREYNGRYDINHDTWTRDYGYTEHQWNTDCKKALVLLKKVTNATRGHLGSIIFNGDARGYTLKLHDKFIKHNEIEIYKDWGGYGILAPDFNN